MRLLPLLLLLEVLGPSSFVKAIHIGYSPATLSNIYPPFRPNIVVVGLRMERTKTC